MAVVPPLPLPSPPPCSPIHHAELRSLHYALTTRDLGLCTMRYSMLGSVVPRTTTESLGRGTLAVAEHNGSQPHKVA